MVLLMTQTVAGLIATWQGTRAELAALEQAEHPDVTDHHGRVWVWWKGDLYRHCGMAWPLAMIQDGTHSLPSESARTNPNYLLCAICTEGLHP